MIADAPQLLTSWSNFYVIIGSTAGALIGLQFVVIALIANTELAGSNLEIRAFGTPTIVHFCFVLLIAGIVNVPWHALLGVAICLRVCGAFGVGYIVVVIRHAYRQTGYSPDKGDWFWYVDAPLVAYATLLVTGLTFRTHPATSLFVVAGAALALLFAGIHNAWDTVTYVAMKPRGRSRQENEN